MARRKFKIAFSTIGTVQFVTFLKLVLTYKVYPRYYWRCFVAGVISLISEPFRWLELGFYSGRLSKVAMPRSPVFIIGHWRSGTTYMHNAIAQDKQFSFINTYHSVFTNQFFVSRWLFKPLMKILLPEKRPADNVLLSLELPQEEGIALSNMNSLGFYNFFYFPQDWKSFYKQYINGEGSSPTQLEAYGRRYKRLIAQALLEYDRKEFISKFPPNTGYIKHLLQLFPDAKFIYTYRNPMMVFHSTVHFFEATHEALKLQPFEKPDFEEMVFELYELLIKDYEEQKSLIPKEHLVEIRYEDFQKDPLEGLQQIYLALGIKGFDQALPAFTNYVNEQKKFEKASHSFDREEVERIRTRLDFAFKLYGYGTEVNQER